MTGCQAELCASNVALPEHVRAGRTCSGKATLRTGRLAGWDTQHTSMSPPLLWRLGSCSASHTAVMVQAPARGLSAGLLLTHDAWHPHWTTLGPTPVKKDQEFARNRSAMVRLARGNAIGPSAERKPRIFHTVFGTLVSAIAYGSRFFSFACDPLSPDRAALPPSFCGNPVDRSTALRASTSSA